MHEEGHYINRSGWLRAAVLGANDGIISVSSIAVGVAAASVTREPILLAALAGTVAGALSMAAGEYISVSSQSDLEKADLEREAGELRDHPEYETEELAGIYRERGLDAPLARQVAEALMAHDPLQAHARDELGISKLTQSQPLSAAFASGVSFLAGAALPVLVALFAPLKGMVFFQYGATLVALVALGALAARTGGARIWMGIFRICLWGTLAMAGTAAVGYLFGVEGL
ncbi:VIT family protein [Lewinella sp. IMCC34183]|uniref:VIT1/CCC1 transporter family protein n=1 Tax=Lewinella sp. IMCC34183 TaxID=2248762 RepID=UPI000E241C46|nr:VIT family protein [Lewinella sp. IMCC34183]